jgi:hypothetical protein
MIKIGAHLFKLGSIFVQGEKIDPRPLDTLCLIHCCGNYFAAGKPGFAGGVLFSATGCGIINIISWGKGRLGLKPPGSDR